MIDRLGGNRQPDLFVRTTNILDPKRIPARIQTELASLLKVLAAVGTRVWTAQGWQCRRRRPLAASGSLRSFLKVRSPNRLALFLSN